MIRRRRLGVEDSELIVVFDWLKLKKLRHISWHTPNESKRSPAAGALMKRKGMLAGVSDIIVARQSNGYGGLFIELKTDDGKPTPAQIEFVDNMRQEGYCAHICYSADEAIAFIESYLHKD